MTSMAQAAAFRRWCEYAEEVVHQHRLLSRAVASIAHRATAAAFGSWYMA
eukprot:SAG25_NODE_15209_length_149_cov_134.420000_1_plen_49_part_11